MFQQCCPHDDAEFEDASELMCLSAAAMGDKNQSAAMQVEIIIDGAPFLMLIDSGSTHSFLNQKFASQLAGVTTAPPVSVKVADGTMLTSTLHIPTCTWQYGSVEFSSQFRLLSQGAYDGILGLD